VVDKTWKRSDGVPIVDYSSQAPGEKKGKHAESLDRRLFKRFIDGVGSHEVDIMLEIKDKQKSALRAMDIVREKGQ
jgi:UV DNA damage endonuclease